MIKRILINREESEIRVGFLEDQELVELHTEAVSEKSLVGNIYRGVVEDVKPGLQAAFIDCGLERNVFLHFMDIRAESLVLDSDDLPEAIQEAAERGIPGQIIRPGRRPRQDPRAPQGAPPIKKGDHILVQVVKEEIGGKAPRVTANVSIPGRYLVLLPYPSQQGGVSRKIAVGESRMRLKKLLSNLRREDCSFIIRTAGVNQPEEAIQQDVEFLLHLWEGIIARYRSLKGPGLVYNEHEIVGRLVRDAFALDVDEIHCDDKSDVEEVRMHLREYAPQLVDQVQHYTGVESLFEHFDVEKQIQRALNRKVWLKSGGFLIVDENEALTAIDVNTGRFTGGKDQEKTSLKTNMEACRVIADQIRLRDIGGIIVIDFIDMLNRGNQEAVADELRHHLKRDRGKVTVGRIGDFGVLVMTRKRQKMSLQKHVFEDCPYCAGSGWVLRREQIFRKLKYELRTLLADSLKTYAAVVITANPEMADALEGEYHGHLRRILGERKTELMIRRDLDCHIEDYTIQPVVKAAGLRVHRPVSKRVEEHVLREAQTGDDLEPVRREYEPQPVVAARTQAPGATTPPTMTAAPSAVSPAHWRENPPFERQQHQQPQQQGPSNDDRGGRKRRRRRGGRGGRDRFDDRRNAPLHQVPSFASSPGQDGEPDYLTDEQLDMQQIEAPVELDTSELVDDSIPTGESFSEEEFLQASGADTGDGEDDGEEDAAGGFAASSAGDGPGNADEQDGGRRSRRGRRGGRRRRGRRDREVAASGPGNGQHVPPQAQPPRAAAPRIEELPPVSAASMIRERERFRVEPRAAGEPARPVFEPREPRPPRHVPPPPPPPAPVKTFLLPTITLTPGATGPSKVVQVWPPPPKTAAAPPPAPAAPAPAASPAPVQQFAPREEPRPGGELKRPRRPPRGIPGAPTMEQIEAQAARPHSYEPPAPVAAPPVPGPAPGKAPESTPEPLVVETMVAEQPATLPAVEPEVEEAQPVRKARVKRTAPPRTPRVKPEPAAKPAKATAPKPKRGEKPAKEEKPRAAKAAAKAAPPKAALPPRKGAAVAARTKAAPAAKKKPAAKPAPAKKAASAKKAR